MSHTQKIIKSVFDRIVALFVLLVASPILFLAMLMIAIASPGPVFFTQERIGLRLKPFRIFKLRTMHVNAGGSHLGSTTIRDDPRVFSVGKWLRKLKVDEIPQLINVLEGSMSLVGPRPTVEEDYQRMTVEQKRRADVKPGITGLAQIQGSTSIKWPERIRFDLNYIDKQSLWLDLKILFETALMCILLKADSHPQDESEW